MMRQQQWSQRALDSVLEMMNKDKKTLAQQRKYKTLCMKMAGVIQRSGLTQAVVFVQSRGEAQMGPTFCDDLAHAYGLKDGRELRQRVQNADLAEYLALTRDLIEVAVWFRRFAQIEMAGIKEADLDPGQGDSSS